MRDRMDILPFICNSWCDLVYLYSEIYRQDVEYISVYIFLCLHVLIYINAIKSAFFFFLRTVFKSPYNIFTNKFVVTDMPHTV